MTHTKAIHTLFAKKAMAAIAILMLIPLLGEACPIPHPEKAPDAAVILNFNPRSAGPGSTIYLYGRNFRKIPAGSTMGFHGRNGGVRGTVIVDTDIHARVVIPSDAKPDARGVPMRITRGWICPGRTESTSVVYASTERGLQGNPEYFVVTDLPANPSEVIAAAYSHTAIQLTWQDNASDEEGYIVSRVDRRPTRIVELARTSPNQTSLNLVQLKPEEIYTFTVSTFNRKGDTPDVTENHATVMTLPAPVGTGRMTVATGGDPSPLCETTQRAADGVFSYADVNGNGIVDGYSNSDPANPGGWPLFPVARVQPDPPYRAYFTIETGNQYMTKATLVANVVVNGVFRSCASARPQFVAIHLQLIHLGGDRYSADGVQMYAGDYFDSWSPNPNEPAIQGTVMLTPDFELSLSEFKPPTDVADGAIEGFVLGNVAFAAPGIAPRTATVRFDFDTPVQTN